MKIYGFGKLYLKYILPKLMKIYGFGKIYIEYILPKLVKTNGDKEYIIVAHHSVYLGS